MNDLRRPKIAIKLAGAGGTVRSRQQICGLARTFSLLGKFTHFLFQDLRKLKKRQTLIAAQTEPNTRLAAGVERQFPPKWRTQVLSAPPRSVCFFAGALKTRGRNRRESSYRLFKSNYFHIGEIK